MIIQYNQGRVIKDVDGNISIEVIKDKYAEAGIAEGEGGTGHIRLWAKDGKILTDESKNPLIGIAENDAETPKILKNYKEEKGIRIDD
jgi:hypothetical protein